MRGNVRAGHMRFLVGRNIGLSIIMFGGQEHENRRNDPKPPEHPNMRPFDAAAAHERSQDFTKNHHGDGEGKQQS